ncbi:MAG: hypothetical protein ACNS61_16045 [Candidatus Wenzhouxiangella sp. M2_3B_020]
MTTASRTDRPRLRLVSCIGTEFDLPLLDFFIAHYRGLGVEPSRMHFIVHATERTSENFDAALSLLESRGTAAPMRWIGPYTSTEMWQRRRALQQSVSQQGDWIVSADVDEFHEYPEYPEQLVDYCEANDYHVLQGPFIDRISDDGVLRPVDPTKPLAEQYPLEAEVMCHIGKIPGKADAAGTVKLMLFRSDVMPGLGGHGTKPDGNIRFLNGTLLSAFPRIKTPDFRFELPAKVHHFKWRESMLTSISERWRTPGSSPAGSEYGKRLYAYFDRSGSRILLSNVRIRCRSGDPTGSSDALGRMLVVPQKRNPEWQTAYEELRKIADAMSTQGKPRDRTAAPASGWRMRQLTEGTQSREFHSHSYYDIRIVDSTNSWIAAHRMGFQDRWMTPEDSVCVGVVGLDGTGFEPISETSAWSWQQGPMAQWIPGTGRIIWNQRISDDRFEACEYDHESGEMRNFPLPVYAIGPSGSYALCVNMARLDRVRPGYGYARVSRDGPIDPVPADDGVYRLDLETGEYELILSLERAAECLFRNAPPELCAKVRALPPAFWFNHVKISPDGSRFTVKLRWRDRALEVGWNGRMGVSLTCGTDGSNLAYLQHATSHVMWWSSSILYYWHELTRALKFIKDSSAGGIELGPVMPGNFEQNVHIRHVPDRPFEVIYDLPYRETVELKELSLETGRVAHIASFPNHLPKHGPFRCDLHPVPAEDGHRVIVTSLQDGGRQIYALEREN